MEIKICGITSTTEIDKLIECKVDYAGFVVNYSKSKRNNTFEEAKDLVDYLKEKRIQSDSKIQAVAVMVSPDISDIENIMKIGFDIVQIHGEIHKEVYEACNIPIFVAINVKQSDSNANESIKMFINNKRRWQDGDKESKAKLVAILFDGAVPGTGKSFEWNIFNDLDEQTRRYFKTKKIILAGGLNHENVKNAIEIIKPDIVDCSSGVEYDDKDRLGKDLLKVEKFVEEVRR